MTALPAEGETIEGLPLKVQVNPRARRISLRLCTATRSVRLTLPPRASRARAAAFLEEQRPWIRTQASLRLAPILPFRPGSRLPLGNGLLQLEPGTGRTARREGDRLLVPGEGVLFSGRVRRWLKAEALRTLEPPTHALAGQVGRTLRSVTVGEYRSRWGSCAPDGRITYNWRLVLAPIAVQQAVIAHEVAHLVHPNHGSEFWALATSLLGRPHTAARRWLRENGPGLAGIGAG